MNGRKPTPWTMPVTSIALRSTPVGDAGVMVNDGAVRKLPQLLPAGFSAGVRRARRATDRNPRQSWKKAPDSRSPDGSFARFPGRAWDRIRRGEEDPFWSR